MLFSVLPLIKIISAMILFLSAISFSMVSVNVSVKSRNNSSFLLYKWYQRAGIVKLAILICQTSFEDLPQNENIKVFDLAYILDF